MHVCQWQIVNFVSTNSDSAITYLKETRIKCKPSLYEKDSGCTYKEQKTT